MIRITVSILCKSNEISTHAKSVQLFLFFFMRNYFKGERLHKISTIFTFDHLTWSKLCDLAPFNHKSIRVYSSVLSRYCLAELGDIIKENIPFTLVNTRLVASAKTHSKFIGATYCIPV